MKITTKINLMLISVFSLGLLIVGFVSYRMLHENARNEVITHAGMMMEAALAIRGYTVKEIRPLLALQMKRQFLPQSVPSYAATQNFKALRQDNPEYTYKEATLNPTNPRDHAADWETDIINDFRNTEDKKQIIGERNTPTGKSLYLARPIRIKNKGCLTCHSTVDAAPKTMIKYYGTANGFGWQHNEVVGAQIVSVPLAVPIKKANKAFTVFIASLVVIFVSIFLLINLMLRKLVIKPVVAMSVLADEVSKGNMNAPAFDSSGGDEIAELSSSFNRMRISLEKAMTMLEE